MGASVDAGRLEVHLFPLSGIHSAMKALEGDVAIVTGGTFGVGRGIASALAHCGARVFVTGRSVKEGAPIEDRITGIRCDHRLDAEVAAAFERVARETQGAHILVNNVWGGYERMIEDGACTWGKPFWEQPLWRWGLDVQRRSTSTLPREPTRRADDGCPPAWADREHLVLGRTEAHRERCLRGLES